MGNDIQNSGLDAFWREIPVAILVDIDPTACQIDPAIRPLKPLDRSVSLFGRAVTALCEPPDFGAVLRAVDLIKEGDVLVIAASGHADTAMIGEIVSGQVRRRGGAGVICDGAVRDVAEIVCWEGFEVFTRHITPRGPTGTMHGAVNETVKFGGVDISPGDLIIGDHDGLASLTPQMAREFVEPARARTVLEADWQRRLASGESVADVFLD